MSNKPEVTSAKLSNRLKTIGLTSRSKHFRDYTGSKNNEVECSNDGRKYYFVDNVNCYTAEELGNILIHFIEHGEWKP